MIQLEITCILKWIPLIKYNFEIDSFKVLDHPNFHLVITHVQEGKRNSN